MAETHELRLKINAAAAKSGSRDFTRAIMAIKTAVRDLERDTNGVFTRISKNIKSISSGKVKFKGVDKAAINSLDRYARMLQQANTSTIASRKSISAMSTQLQTASGAYMAAKVSVDAFNKSLLTMNTALARQVSLANAARGAVGQVRAKPTTIRGGRADGGRGAEAANKALERQASLHARNEKAMSSAALQAEQLTLKLAKMGAGASIGEVIKALQMLQSSLGKSGITARESSTAMAKFATSLNSAKTSLTTLTAKAQEEAAAEKNATAALNAAAKATGALAKATNDLTSAKVRAQALTDKNVAAQLASASAMRRAEEDAARLTARLRNLGDTRGISEINAALLQLRARLSGTVGSTLEVRKAMNDFANATSRTKVSLIQSSAAQAQTAKEARTLAAGESAAAKNARMLERELRSASGAAGAASKSFRSATGSLRGLENAFSSSFQIGSAFRGLLGTITIASFTKSVFNAGDALAQFNVTMKVASDTAFEAADNFKFVEELARGFGTGLSNTRTEFAKFAVASNIAGVSVDNTRKIFGAVARSLTVLGRGTEDQRLAFLALEQMMSKGCHAPGTMIRMSDGSTKKVEDVHVGEYLMGPDEEPRLVIALAEGREEMFCVTPSEGTPFVVNKHHKLRVYRNGVAETLILADYLDDSNNSGLRLVHASRVDVAFYVESVGDGEFHGFFISDDHLYLDAQGFVHHNTISAEELRRQLGERLPGAVNLMAKAVGVSTSELQKMLKAGTLMSAEVLPKFADVLNETFGPGLEAALGRAGTQFRIFQTEIEKFFEAVSQSGFLQVLSVEFRALVTLMRSGGVKEAGERLGKSFADGARLFGAGARFIIENVNEIGAAFKAIFIGLLVRSLTKVVSGIANFIVQLIAAKASLMASAAAEQTHTVAVQAGTIAQVTQTQAIASGNVAMAISTGLLTKDTIAQGANNATLVTGAAARTASFFSIGRLGKSLKGLVTTGAGIASIGKFFGTIAGPVGIAVTALSFLPLIFNDTAEAADEAAGAYHDALVRMGLSNKTFLNSAVEVSELSTFDRLTRNAGEYISILKELTVLNANVGFTGEITAGAESLAAAIPDKAIKEMVTGFAAGVKQLLALGAAGEVTAKQIADLEAEARKIKTELASTEFSEPFDALTKSLDIVLALTSGMAELNKESRVAGDFEFIGRANSVELHNFTLAMTEARMGMKSLIEEATSGQASRTFGFTFSIGAENVRALTSALDGTPASANAASAAVGKMRAKFDASTTGTKNQRDAIENLISELEEMVDAYEDGAIGAGRMRTANEGLLETINDVAAGFRAAVEAAQEVKEAAGLISGVQDKINALSRSTGAALDERLRIAGLSEREAAIEEVLNDILLEDAVFLAALGNLATIRTKLAGEAVSSVARAGLGEAADELNATLDRIRNRVATRAGDVVDAEASGKRKRKTDAEREADRQQKALDKLREASSSTAGALIKLREVEVTLAFAMANLNLGIDERNLLLGEAEQRAFDQIAAEADLGQVFRTNADLFAANSTAISAANKLRAVEVEFLRETGKALDSVVAKRFLESTMMDIQQDKRNEALSSMREFIVNLQEETEVLKAVNSEMFQNADVAEQVIQMRRAGIEVNKEFIDTLNEMAFAQEQLTREAANPAKAWLEAVPSFREAGQMIEADIFDSLSDAMTQLANTGKFSFDDMLMGMINSATAVVNDIAIKELLTLFGIGESGFGLGDLFGSSDADPKATTVSPEDVAALNQGAFGFKEAILGGSESGALKMKEGLGEGALELNQGVVSGSMEGAQIMHDQIVSAMANTPVGGSGDGGGGITSVFGGGGSLPSSGVGASGERDDIGMRLETGIVSGAVTGAKTLAASLTEAGTGLGGLLESVFGEAGSSFNGIFGSIFSSLSGLFGGGGGGGTVGAISSIATTLIGAYAGGGFKAGGLTSNPSPVNTGFAMHPAMFKGAPSFSDGTNNTSGIPAILHENEAVIPLTGNRKVPVELEIAADGGGAKVIQVTQNFNFPNGDADSFRRSQGQVAAEAAMTANSALRNNG